METEPNPMDYNQFEGVIPEGQYGGGTVMIWDKGVWAPATPHGLGDDRGAVIVELAIVIPVLLLFVFGLIDVGLLAFGRTQSAAAARDGARAALVDFDQVDIVGSANNARVKAAATAHLDVRSPAVAVRCLNSAGGAIACSTATATVDRVELTVSWDRSSITFVGAIIGQSQHISSTAAMVVAGRAGAAPVVPITTSTSSTTTTVAPTTTTSTTTTSTTLLGCTVTAASVAPPANSLQGASGHLTVGFTVSVTTVGLCPSGIRLVLPNVGGPTTVTVPGTGPLFTSTVGRNDYTWTSGLKTLTIQNAATGVTIGNAVFTVL